jgi:hypothetical protein
MGDISRCRFVGIGYSTNCCPHDVLASMKSQKSFASICLALGLCVPACSIMDKSQVGAHHPVDQEMGDKVPAPATRSFNHDHDPNDQSRTLVDLVGGVSVYRHIASNAVFWKHGLMIDVDGAPNAYSPAPGKGLDFLADAGHPGNWWAIVTRNGVPVIQTATDPSPGYYVSTTSLQNHAYPQENPKRWVDATRIPYVVLPLQHHDFGGRLGDFGAAINLSNNRTSYFIVADLGPPHQIGEGSFALANALGVNPSAKTGGVGDGILYILFPNSGDAKVKEPAEISRSGKQLFAQFGGIERLFKIIPYQ